MTTRVDMNNKHKVNSWIVYGTIIAVVSICTLFATFFSTAHAVDHNTAPNSTRDALGWMNPPDRMSKAWESEGYTGVINTPGSIIGVNDNGVSRLDSETGLEIWKYHRPDSQLCDAINADGQVAVLFDSGHGCTDITLLDSATGEYISQAQYATDETEARLIYGRDHIGIVTHSNVRLVRASDLVPTAFYGDMIGPIYESDQAVSQCDISDVVIGPDSFAVASKCNDDPDYRVRVVQNDPEESTQGNILLDIGTGVADPSSVTLPVISKSMVIFVVQGISPTAYVWQLDKDMEEVAAFPVGVNSYGFNYQDIRQFGYTWRIGTDVHYRQGSEDLSKSIVIPHAIGDPMVAEIDLLVPVQGGIEVATFNKEKEGTRLIPIEGFPSSRSYAFSGRTVAAHDGNSKIIGFN